MPWQTFSPFSQVSSTRFFKLLLAWFAFALCSMAFAMWTFVDQMTCLRFFANHRIQDEPHYEPCRRRRFSQQRLFLNINAIVIFLLLDKNNLLLVRRNRSCAPSCWRQLLCAVLLQGHCLTSLALHRLPGLSLVADVVHDGSNVGCKLYVLAKNLDAQEANPRDFLVLPISGREHLFCIGPEESWLRRSTLGDVTTVDSNNEILASLMKSFSRFHCDKCRSHGRDDETPHFLPVVAEVMKNGVSSHRKVLAAHGQQKEGLRCFWKIEWVKMRDEIYIFLQTLRLHTSLCHRVHGRYFASCLKYQHNLICPPT